MHAYSSTKDEVFYKKNCLEGLFMATFSISKEVVVTLKYYYEKEVSLVETTLK